MSVFLSFLSITQMGWSLEEYRSEKGCRGLTITEVATIDFGLIDFSEWIDMMAQSGMLPEDGDMDSVTRGSMANAFNRDNTLERMESRGGSNNTWVDRMTEIEGADMINNIDCSSRPRPQSCEVGTIK